MIHRSHLAATAVLALSFCTAHEAQATVFCNIKPTRDGFVALRAGPDASSRLIARMTVRDEVQAHDEQRGSWIRVTWWKGGRFKTQRAVGYDPPNGSGWVHSRLLEETCG